MKQTVGSVPGVISLMFNFLFFKNSKQTSTNLKMSDDQLGELRDAFNAYVITA